MKQHSQDPGEFAGGETATPRQDSRDSLFLMADIREANSDTVRQVRVRNLSASGLMADFSGEMKRGLRVEIGVRGFGWVPGEVAWSGSGRIGMMFDHQIDPLCARKPVGQGTHTPIFVKPVLPRGKRR